MPSRTSAGPWLARAAGAERQLLRLRRALRAGNALDALAAAARIHAIAVRPNMRHGGWARAQAYCERMLSQFPDRRARGYLPRLRLVIEYLHADAAIAARERGDIEQAKAHLAALVGYLQDRRTPAAQLAAALIDLAYVHIAAGETRTGGRILADVGQFLTTGQPAPTGCPIRSPRTPVAAIRQPAAQCLDVAPERPILRAGRQTAG